MEQMQPPPPRLHGAPPAHPVRLLLGRCSSHGDAPLPYLAAPTSMPTTTATLFSPPLPPICHPVLVLLGSSSRAQVPRALAERSAAATGPVRRRCRGRRGGRADMEDTAAAATAPEEKASSYRYWVREATGDAAPLPVPRKLDPAATAANDNGNCNTPPLGSVWNHVALLLAGVVIGAAYTECSYLFNGAPPKWSPKVGTGHVLSELKIWEWASLQKEELLTEYERERALINSCLQYRA